MPRRPGSVCSPPLTSFCAEGVHTGCIDRIVEHAGVAKASLYWLFGSKEGLVGLHLAARHERTMSESNGVLEHHPDARAVIVALFDAQSRCLRRRNYRGCAFARATTKFGVGAAAQRD